VRYTVIINVPGNSGSKSRSRAPMEQKKQPKKYSKDKGEPMPYPCDQKAFSKISLIQKLTG